MTNYQVPDERLREDVRRGRQASEFFEEDSAPRRALRAVKNEYIQQWANSIPSDTAGREQTYARLRALADFENRIATEIQNGQLAERELMTRQKRNV